MFKGIDLYSDTATKPSAAMKQAMLEAPVGDEQLGEDPTTKKLETTMAERLGKSCALFFPSATMANQIAVKLHTEAGDEVIAHEHCHIFNAEGAAAAIHSHVQARMIPSKTGIFGADEIRTRFRKSSSPNSPRTGLLIVENTTNAGGGYAWPLGVLDEVVAATKYLSLKSHLDGSRLYNAAVKSQCDVARLSAGFDSVTICFSKGFGCPMGAILAFDAKDWARVRKLKQIFGGSMRQSGMLAAAALFALEHHCEGFALDHEKATRLAQGLAQIPGLMVEDQSPSTNMVFFRVARPEAFNEASQARGLRFSHFGEDRFRAVTHRDLSLKDIDVALEIVADIAN